ncbi:MAG: SDR family NAD(P)-dependent oxidoreductase, partial [Candidatus Sungbacteria bacterium]|nr:SDR family NAD(P)-dependent oxidoreductase [Candidatus Sungbacteria bacterium]
MKAPEEIFSVRDKAVIITGGAGMLGREYAAFLLAAGARVALFDIVQDPKLPEGTFARYMKVDITDRDAVFAAVADVAKEYGRVDVLINNAAMNPVPGSPESKDQFSPYEDYPKELWEKELSAGLSGALFCTQAVIPAMKRQGSGSIINISSTYGNVGPDNRIYGSGKYKSIGYAATKGAVLNFTRAWASY